MYYELGADLPILEYAAQVKNTITDAWYNAKVKDGAGPVSTEQNALANIKKRLATWLQNAEGLATHAPMVITEKDWRDQGAMFEQSTREIQGYAKDASLKNVLKQTAAATFTDIKQGAKVGFSWLPWVAGAALVFVVVRATFSPRS